MNDRVNSMEPLGPVHSDPADANDGRESAAEGFAPLPGEPGIPDVAARRTTALSRKGLFALVLLIVSLGVAAAFSARHFLPNRPKSQDADFQRVSDRPMAASGERRRLEMPPAPILAASAPAASGSAASVAAGPRIPAIVPTAEEAAEPIGVRRTGAVGPGPAGASRSIAPEDAPMLLVSTRPAARADVQPSRQPDAEPAVADPADPLAATARNLEGYQRQLQGLLENLTKTTTAITTPGGPAGAASPFGGLPAAPTAAGGSPAASAQGAAPSTGSSLFGGQLQGLATARVAASMLGDRSLTLPKGTAFTCALKTKVINASSGLVGCQVQRNVFSDDGRVLLIERGSHLDGEYRVTSIRPGTVRIPVLWTRIRTPHGVTVDIASPGTGPLGESGIDGYVDNRWGERIGAAMLLSLIDDSVKLVIQGQSNDSAGSTVVLPSTTASTSKLAEKVLDSTINIPPLIYQNQGGIVGIYVARDVDFSGVYELRPTPITASTGGQP